MSFHCSDTPYSFRTPLMKWKGSVRLKRLLFPDIQYLLQTLFHDRAQRDGSGIWLFPVEFLGIDVVL